MFMRAMSRTRRCCCYDSRTLATAAAHQAKPVPSMGNTDASVIILASSGPGRQMVMERRQLA
eukprot:6191492-Pleurochrysis_carterae.AAC.1